MRRDCRWPVRVTNTSASASVGVALVLHPLADARAGRHRFSVLIPDYGSIVQAANALLAKTVASTSTLEEEAEKLESVSPVALTELLDVAVEATAAKPRLVAPCR